MSGARPTPPLADSRTGDTASRPRPPGPTGRAGGRLAVGRVLGTGVGTGVGTVVGVGVAAAALSLALPAGLGYDPWAWLVWGREVTRGELSTDGGPSWKPLPVLVTTVLAGVERLVGLDGAAPHLWLLLARAGGLIAIVMTYRLATRFAGAGAGVVAVLALLLTPDSEARWIRHLAQGNIEPMTVGLCLLAVKLHLDGRRELAFALGAAAALARPEVWPFLVVYGAWLCRREQSRWQVVVPVLAAVALLWFGADWWASGDPWVGAERAQVVDGTLIERLVPALVQVGEAVIVPVWLAAAVCVVMAARRREPALLVLTAAALAWIAIVAAMTAVFGYAALGRFLAPPAAVLCVLAGVAAARLVARRGLLVGAAVAVVMVAGALPFAVARLQWLPVQVGDAVERSRLEGDLDVGLEQAGGREALIGCGGLVTEGDRPALAWKLDVSLADVWYELDGRPGVSFVRVDATVDRNLSSNEAAEELARTSEWAVFAVDCPAGVDRSAGVGGSPGT